MHICKFLSFETGYHPFNPCNIIFVNVPGSLFAPISYNKNLRLAFEQFLCKCLFPAEMNLNCRFQRGPTYYKSFYYSQSFKKSVVIQHFVVFQNSWFTCFLRRCVCCSESGLQHSFTTCFVFLYVRKIEFYFSSQNRHFTRDYCSHQSQTLLQYSKH